jgi:DNA topoisomerase-1
VKLVIVESPAKAKTIEKFLGAGYKVAASYGHIRDLPGSAKEIPAKHRKESWARLGVNTDDDYRPVYIVPATSKKQVTELKKLMAKADELLLATDEDREGESISWHLLEVLEPKVPVKRITFHEITRSAIQKALENARSVDEKLVRAQEARRVLDRLFGYELSPVLWKKVRTKLSAGRVQSAALRLVVEREEERQAFQETPYWDVRASFTSSEGEVGARLAQVAGQRVAQSRDFDSTTGVFDPKSKAVILDQTKAEIIADVCKGAIPWNVANVEKKATRQKPAAPFTTSTLQQAASSQLRMSPKQAMRVAQFLYEGVDLGAGDREGLITYMRTDSVTLSEDALKEAGDFITEEFGERFHDGARTYKTKAKSAQEAHEAIRPTHMGRKPADVADYLTDEQLEVYGLIWSRAVASQMTDAEIDRTTIDLVAEAKDGPYTYRTTGSVLTFPGFKAVMGRDANDQLLPAVSEGDSVGAAGSAMALDVIEADGHETRPPPRYTEASLVKQLEELGIGRPSTYTPTISTIQDRDYVFKKGTALIPTYVGMAVTRLLRDHFPHYVDLQFTAKLEGTLDGISEGKVDSIEFLSGFYKGDGEEEGLVNAIERRLPEIEYPAIPLGLDPENGEEIRIRIGKNAVYVQRGEGDDAGRATLPMDLLIDELTPQKANELIAARSKADEPLGTDEATGKALFLKVGPYGPYVQLGELEEGSKPKRVSLPKGMKLEDVTLEEARRLISLPRFIGVDEATGENVNAGLGRYGPYVERAGTYRSIGSMDDVYGIGLEEAITLINEKRKKPTKTVLMDVGEHPESGKPIQLFEGRYGPYVSDGSANASIPKGKDPMKVTVPEAVELLVAAAARKKAGGGRKTKRS